MLIVDVAPIAGLWPREVVRTPAAARAPLNHFGLLAGLTPRQALACIHRYVAELGGTNLIVGAGKGIKTFYMNSPHGAADVDPAVVMIYRFGHRDQVVTSDCHPTMLENLIAVVILIGGEGGAPASPFGPTRL